MAPSTDFEPYVAEEDLVADLPDGRTIQVATKGQTVTPQLLREIGVTPLVRRVDEPSQHSTPHEKALAAKTNESVRAGALKPRNETQRQGIDQKEIADVNASDAPEPDAPAKVRPAGASDEDAETKSPKARTGAKPAPKE